MTVGYERQLRGNIAVSADYVHSHSRDLLMSLNLNPQQRSNPNVNASTLTRIGSPPLTAAMAVLQAKYPELRSVHRRGDAVRERRPRRLRRVADAAEEALLEQLQRAGVLHARQFAREHLRQRRSGQQLPGRAGHAPGAQRRADRLRLSVTTSRSAARRSFRTRTV